MDSVLFEKAAEIEREHPEKACKIYRKLGRGKSHIRWDVLSIATVFPVIGFLIAFFGIQSLSYQSDIWRVVTWILVGFTPIGIYELTRKQHAQLIIMGNSFSGRAFFAFPFIWFSQFFLMGAVAAILYFFILISMSFNSAFSQLLEGYWMFQYMFLWLEEIPPLILWPAIAVSSLAAFLRFSTEVPFRRLYLPRLLLLAITSNPAALLLWFSPIPVALIIAGGISGFVNNHFYAGAVLSLVSGLTLGFLLAPVKEMEERDTDLLQIAIARCLIRIRQYSGAELLLERKRAVMKGHVDSSNQSIWYLVCALLHTVKNNSQKDALRCLEEAPSALSSNSYRGLYRDYLSHSLQETEQLIKEYDFTDGQNKNDIGALCYILGWISGLPGIVLARKNKFLLFHAIQSTIIFGILTIMYYFLATVYWLPFFVDIWIRWLIIIITLILWMKLMANADKKAPYKLPWLGNLIAKWVG